MDDFLDTRCEKLRELETATIFIKGKDSMKNEFLEMRSEVSQVSAGLEALRRSLGEMKAQNQRCKELSNLLESLDRRILHVSEHVPTRLIHDYQSNKPQRDGPAPETIPVEQPEPRDCKKILFDEPEVCVNIQPISSEEFSKIPKYIIGRQSLEALNGFLETINQVLRAKYEILAMGMQQARKQGVLNLYLQFVKEGHDMADEKDASSKLYFFTGVDYERQTKSKLNKIKLNLLTVLRHCKRLREYRCKNDLRYVVIT